MKNLIRDGNAITRPAPAGGTVAGRVYLFGDIIGVAQKTNVAGVPTVFNTDRAVYQFGKPTAQAWTDGAKLYWDAAASVLTTVVGANILVANADGAAAATPVVGNARLRPVAG